MGKYKEQIFNSVLLIIGLVLFILSLYHFSVRISLIDFIILLIFAIILDNLGIIYTDIKLSLSPAVGMAVFIIYGFLPAAMLMIASTMFDTMVMRKKIKNGFLNGAMFSTTYIIAGWVFLFIGGKTGIVELYQINYILVYVIVSFLVNNFILYYALKVQGKILFKEYWNESVILELLTYIIMLPISLLVSYIYFKYNFNMFVLSLTPLIFIAYVFRMVRDLIKANKRLNAVYDMVKIINSKLELDKVFDAIIDVISRVVSISGAAVYIVDGNGISVLGKAVANKNIQEVFKQNYFKDEGIIGKCINTNKTILCRNIKEDDIFNKEYFSEYFNSGIVVPMRFSGNIIGCLLILQVEVGAFDEDASKIVEIIADQSSIAIINAKKYYEVSKSSITDPLTKTYNRRYFNDALLKNILKSNEDNVPVSLIMFDLDNFKHINDTYGHLVGDEVLREVAKRIKNNVRDNDIVSRFGGEEFTVILPKLVAEQAYMIAERIRNEISLSPISTSKGDIYITITGGVADYPKKADSAEKLISHADRALYAGGKSKGRNKIAIYEV